MTSYQTSGVITNAGIAAAIAAGSGGPQINITGFQIGSLSAVDGSTALVTDTSVDGLVYTGTSAAMTYLVVDPDTVMWRIELDPSVGNFNVGNVGILIGTTLFAKAVLPGPSVKYKTLPPTTVGNIKFYNIIMRLANVANLLNLTLTQSLIAAIPEVPTELVLPPALSSPFDCYMVDNHTHLGVPTTALRLNGNWYHAPHRQNAGQAQGAFGCLPALFDPSVPAIAAVTANGSGSLVVADGASFATAPMGMRTAAFEVTTLGQVDAALVGLTKPLLPGTVYYVGTGLAQGTLVTAATGYPVATAVSTTDVFLDFPAVSPGFVARSIQNETWVAFPDTGVGADAMVVTPNPLPLSYAAGQMWVVTKNALANVTTAPVANIGGLGNRTVVDRHGKTLAAGDLGASTVLLLYYDGLNLRNLGLVANDLLGLVPLNVPNPTLYVRTDGNDANDGSANTAAKAMRTIQGAVNQASTLFNLTGRTLTIQLGIPGTYAPVFVSSIPNVTITGNVAAQDTYVISGTSPVLVYGCTLTLNGVQLYNTTPNTTHTIQANFGGSVLCNAVTFSGNSGGAGTSIAHATAAYGGSITFTGPIKMQSNIAIGVLCVSGTFTFGNFITVTQSGAPNYVTAFCFATTLGAVNSLPGVTFTGAASGPRYLGVFNSVINTGGSGVNAFPGNVAGSVSTGSVYA